MLRLDLRGASYPAVTRVVSELLPIESAKASAVGVDPYVPIHAGSSLFVDKLATTSI